MGHYMSELVMVPRRGPSHLTLFVPMVLKAGSAFDGG